MAKTEMDDAYLYREHKELSKSRMNRDAEDLQKFVSWMRVHNPFSPKYNKGNWTCSVYSGVKGDETINCDRAYEIGKELMSAKMKETKFADIKLSRNDRVKNLASLTSSVKV